MVGTFVLAAAAALASQSGWVDVRDEMGKNFRLVEASFVLDGSEVSHVRAPPGEELPRSFRAFEGPLAPGTHALNATLIYEGRNRGVFTYMDDYRFRVSSEYAFDVSESGGPASLVVVARERKGPNVPFEQKPRLEFVPEPGSVITPITSSPRP